jgi:hypothetical protein
LNENALFEQLRDFTECGSTTHLRHGDILTGCKSALKAFSSGIQKPIDNLPLTFVHPDVAVVLPKPGFGKDIPDQFLSSLNSAGVAFQIPLKP